METEIGLMRCRYCNIALNPLRSLADGEFCCDDHRVAFSEQQVETPEAAPAPVAPIAKAEPEPVIPAALQMIRLKFTPPASAPLPAPDAPPAIIPTEIA